MSDAPVVEKPVVEKPVVESEPEPATETETETKAEGATAEHLKEALEELVNGPPFGPSFFQGELGEMVVKETAPNHVPRVRMHLAGGDVLDVTRVLGITPRWVAMRVIGEDGETSSTEIVPYGVIQRVTLASMPADSNRARIGFRQEKALVPVASSPLTTTPAGDNDPK